METPNSFFILYCINVYCEGSIFYHDNKITGHFHAESILWARLCPTCRGVLVSAMDIELEQIAAEAKVKLADKDSDLQRLIRLN